MTKVLKIKTAHRSVLIFGLVFLFLIAPCHVRNFIQATFHAPPTKVLNKSQITISQSGCAAFDIAEIKHLSSKTSLKIVDLFVPNAFFPFHAPLQTKVNNIIKISKPKLISSIPLYILYQNIRVYS